jgi:acetyl-CoA carboxylase/biotin carboxylase 1
MVAEPDQVNGTPNRMSSNRHLSSPSEVDEFCKALGGDSPIHSVLVANNGMAAVKFMRSIRTWALETFGTEKAILLVAMATPEDLRINAEHIRIADQFLEVPGGTNNNNYANVQLIVEVSTMTILPALFTSLWISLSIFIMLDIWVVNVCTFTVTDSRENSGFCSLAWLGPCF